MVRDATSDAPVKNPVFPAGLLLTVLYVCYEDSLMKRITANALIDIGCLVTFIPSLATGLVLYLVLPSGGGRGNGFSTYLGITRNQWVTLHDYTSFAFTALLIIHLLLHWKFFRLKKKDFKDGGDEPGDCRS
jgi:hypothetical protein